jgi:hypothetical protein
VSLGAVSEVGLSVLEPELKALGLLSPRGARLGYLGLSPLTLQGNVGWASAHIPAA